jgi:septum formation protein
LRRPLVLASRSPRRRELLGQAGIEAVCDPAAVEEETVSEGPPWGLAVANAELKAMDVATRRPADVVLGADTIVVFEGEIFGKPRDLAHAEEMLARMVGRTHEVVTGVCVAEWGRRALVTFYETTRVKFRAMDAAEIRTYLASIDPLDKAGAYAAQDDDGRLIECIEGSFTNVVGLPMERLITALGSFYHQDTKAPR